MSTMYREEEKQQQEEVIEVEGEEVRDSVRQRPDGPRFGGIDIMHRLSVPPRTILHRGQNPVAIFYQPLYGPNSRLYSETAVGLEQYSTRW